MILFDILSTISLNTSLILYFTIKEKKDTNFNIYSNYNYDIYFIFFSSFSYWKYVIINDTYSWNTSILKIFKLILKLNIKFYFLIILIILQVQNSLDYTYLHETASILDIQISNHQEVVLLYTRKHNLAIYY